MWKPIRDASRKAIRRWCNNYPRYGLLELEQQKKIISSIETGVLHAAIDKARERNIPPYWDDDRFIDLYSNIGFGVNINLDPDSSINRNNPDSIRTYLISGICNWIILDWLNQNPKFKSISGHVTTYMTVINPREIGYFSPIELNPNINQSYLDELEIRNNQEIKLKYSEMYRCSQCGNKKTQLRNIQTRSSDEGYTTFFTCIVCGHTWRQY